MLERERKGKWLENIINFFSGMNINFKLTMQNRLRISWLCQLLCLELAVRWWWCWFTCCHNNHHHHSLVRLIGLKTNTQTHTHNSFHLLCGTKDIFLLECFTSSFIKFRCLLLACLLAPWSLSSLGRPTFSISIQLNKPSWLVGWLVSWLASIGLFLPGCFSLCLASSYQWLWWDFHQPPCYCYNFLKLSHN